MQLACESGSPLKNAIVAFFNLATCGVLLLLATAGCANNPVLMQSQVKRLEQAQVAAQQTQQELTTRASTLDRDNQELSTLLAQSKQQAQLLSDQVGALREQLADTSSQLASVRDEYSRTTEKTNALSASLQRKAGAAIAANNSLHADLPLVDLAGIEVRQDGDVIRIELPGNQLFTPGSARLLPDAASLVDRVAVELARLYPRQRIGVEGHTDNDPIANSQWANNHQLSVGRAMAVYDHLITHSGLAAEQLFVCGHGANHPVVSNATAAGKDRNRRVELVVYPEHVESR